MGGGGGGRFVGTIGAGGDFSEGTLYAAANVGTMTDAGGGGARRQRASADAHGKTIKSSQNNMLGSAVDKLREALRALKSIDRVTGRAAIKNIERAAELADFAQGLLTGKNEGKAKQGIQESWPKIEKGLKEGWPQIKEGLKKTPEAVWDGITKKK